MISIKRIVPAAVFLCLLLLIASDIFADNMNPEPSPEVVAASQIQDNGPASIPAPDGATVRNPSYKFKRYDFENSVCFKKCHQAAFIDPSKKTEQQWRMLIEKNGHDVFETIVWEYPGQKEQVLMYLIEHAGGSGDEGIGVWN